MTSPFAPVPKPRARLTRGSQSSISSLDRYSSSESMAPDGLHLNTGNLPASSGLNHEVLPSLTGMADITANSVPSLPAVASPIPTPSSPSAPSTPSAPPPIGFLANIISTQIPVLASDAKAVATPSAAAISSAPSTPAPDAAKGAADLESIVSSLANIPGFAGIVGNVVNPGVSSYPSAPPLVSDESRSPSLKRPNDNHTDVGALSPLVISSLDPNNGVKLPPIESPAETRDAAKGENPYVTVLSSWTNQDDGDTESSNEEEAPAGSPSPFDTEGPVATGSDPTADNRLSATHAPLIPTRPVPPRPTETAGQTAKQKVPRKATIRVSRKKGGRSPPAPQSTMVRNSWLDVWKGFRHNVYWVTMDGQLMSMWKKRSDRFSEVLFHVSSITNVKNLDKGRFSVYFKRKHYDFLAHNDDVQEGWVTSLQATRGLPSPTPPEVHGQITIKESRSRVYAAVFGHEMWIYPNKDSFQLGIASYIVPLNVASVMPTGKHSFALTIPHKTFNLTVDSSKDQTTWLNCLNKVISNAQACSQVALRLRENPFNKVCGDCGEANPNWASVNLLLSLCKSCADHHKNLSNNLSKVRSMWLDTKIWTEPVIQLFVTYGNKLANQVWAPAVPAAEQLHPKSTDAERSKFIQDKYSRGRYRRVHPLSSSRSMMEQRLCQVVCTSDLEETMSLICSGAKVCPSDPQSPSPIVLAEKANQALQMELLRLNEYTEVPPHRPQAAHGRLDSTPTGEEEEELHGKLEEDRFLFSLENNSAACDVLDLREVLSVFLSIGSKHSFELVTLDDQLTCDTNSRDEMLEHLVYILKVILPAGVSYAEVCSGIAVCKVCVVGEGGASNPSDAWLLLWEDGISIHPVNKQAQPALMMELSMLNVPVGDPSDNIITMETSERSVSLRFEESYSCQTWFSYLQKALANSSTVQTNPSSTGLKRGFRGSVSPAIERCISHITTYGLKVEGVYRRCGLATKVNKLVETLKTSPNSAPLESDEQGVLDTCSALKQYIRDQESIVPTSQKQSWLQAAANPDERLRFKEYRRLLRQLPDNSRATLNALFGHFYMVQVFSQVNKMSAHNLAVVLVPSLFQMMNQDMIQLSREFIIHHTLLFLTPEKQQSEEEAEEEITFL
ncbi:arf-GAP with Rho-GAP domain, ANK repeat and PH domain-containing protein 1 [Oryzias melastigma]|uniref:arf-GAP with Rho-GAP domain, ANK repeat and PH domain-containing protein 1 n=1 Tax=Oryzias melastigma TaxID=30732 RepID=UPI000CF82BAA|nr:arf-GAP with Rho-GAP domain, ANK repeat and PH domain-containing protein 1 [Oryzias melastigma]